MLYSTLINTRSAREDIRGNLEILNPKSETNSNYQIFKCSKLFWPNVAFHNWTNLHKWSKIEGFFEMKITLSAYVERNKKKFEIPDFCAQLPAYLVEKSL